MRKFAVGFGGFIVFLVTGCATEGGGDARSRDALRPPPVVIRRPAAPAAPPVAAAPVPQQPPAASTRPAERSATPPPPKAAVAPRSSVPRKPDGLASYYAHRYHGRRTASGERFDMRKMTAAHRTLPFGTRVRVTSVANGRSVVVRVNDRGPFVAGRVIDLSLAAARQLDMVRAGVTPVRVEVLGTQGAAATRVASRL